MFLKKIACGLLCAAMLLAAGCGGVGTQTGGDKAYLQLTDAVGRQVSLAKKPERVVSLSPSYLSMIEAVGGTVVGRASSKVGKIPESMKSVPEVGMVYNINMEALVGLKPDLVLASKNQHDKFIPMLQSNKINVVEFDTQTFEDVKGTMVRRIRPKRKMSCWISRLPPLPVSFLRKRNASLLCMQQPAPLR